MCFRSQHHFIVRPRSPNIILDLIARTKAAVRELDNLNYKKMKKILMVETETESTVGDIEGQSGTGRDGLLWRDWIDG